jgi:hypothetical protein
MEAKPDQPIDAICFYGDDFEKLWDRIKNKVTVQRKLAKTLWGSYNLT